MLLRTSSGSPPPSIAPTRRGAAGSPAPRFAVGSREAGRASMAAEDGEGRRRDLGGDRGEEEATAHHPLAMELDTGDALYALLSTRLALLPCLAFLSALPPASRLFLFSTIQVGRVNPNPNFRVLIIFSKFWVVVLRTRKTRPEIFG